MNNRPQDQTKTTYCQILIVPFQYKFSFPWNHCIHNIQCINRTSFTKLCYTSVNRNVFNTKWKLVWQGYIYERVNKTVFMTTFSFMNQTLWCYHSLESSRRDGFNEGHIIGFGWEMRKLSWRPFCSLFLNCSHVQPSTTAIKETITFRTLHKYNTK